MGNKNRVALIIEDNLELGYIYSASLQMAMFDVEHIVDGREALERLEGETTPDLILLDMNLPHVSGHYIYKKLRDDECFVKTPIVIATANALIAETLSDQLHANDHLLIKPVSPTQLRNLANTLCPVKLKR